MPLSNGARLGPYEILSPIGAGGMGEVWLARDTRLNRTVALKVSKVEFSERFAREARAVAALNHPNICQLYDVGSNYLVMEFVEGETLKGPLPLPRAIEYAAQILHALDAAHKKGIIHRDLKPANILVTKHGIKLLDFGLAKQQSILKETDATLPESLTAAGQILGTLQYMAPEQLQGRETDARSDLFSFGCMLYEMLSGKRAFQGGSPASVIAAILERDPAPLDIAPPLHRVVRKCLAKDPDERFQTARDLKTNLFWATEQPPVAAISKSNRIWWFAAVIAIGSGVGGWAIARYRNHEPPIESRLVRYTIQPPENASYAGGKVSPDGRWLAFIGIGTSSNAQLWVRRLDSLTAQPLAKADSDLFWSPDSRFIAFLQDGKLMKIEPSGGAAQTICTTPLVIGGSWNREGTIIFGDSETISQAPAKGGETKRLTTLDASREETAHSAPYFLPDGRHFLYTIYSAKRENGGIYVGSLESPGARVRLLEDISNAAYAPASPADTASGYVLFARGDALLAQRFAAGDLQLKGEAFPVVEKITRAAGNLGASFSASDDGVLLINSRNLINGDRLIWFDRTGKRLGTIGDRGLHFQPQISPNGATVVVEKMDPQRAFFDIWLLPVARDVASRFTFNGSSSPVWSPDGGRIAFVSSTGALFAKTFEGPGKEELLLESVGTPDLDLCDWSKDGRFLVYSQPHPKAKYDLRIMPMSGNRKPIVFLHSEFNERCGALSPDGKWIAYASDESGKYEIYVQAFSEEAAGRGRKWQVSYNGGSWPKWKRDGKELFYLSAAREIVTVEVKTGTTFQPGSPRTLFATGIFTPDARFEVTADGRRFLIPTAGAEGNPTPPTVVLNWTKGVKP